MPRFKAAVLGLLPRSHVFDGELVVLDDAGRPLFNDLMFGRSGAAIRLMSPSTC